MKKTTLRRISERPALVSLCLALALAAGMTAGEMAMRDSYGLHGSADADLLRGQQSSQPSVRSAQVRADKRKARRERRSVSSRPAASRVEMLRRALENPDCRSSAACRRAMERQLRRAEAQE